mmetsp:Transcript_25488/g.37611  ORF Transcript_25488/g.37611 Transcript_25488/m.37611 type:complete len:179 (+) Transcript_25488:73-609(+)
MINTVKLRSTNWNYMLGNILKALVIFYRNEAICEQRSSTYITFINEIGGETTRSGEEPHLRFWIPSVFITTRSEWTKIAIDFLLSQFISQIIRSRSHICRAAESVPPVAITGRQPDPETATQHTGDTSSNVRYKLPVSISHTRTVASLPPDTMIGCRERRLFSHLHIYGVCIRALEST